MQCIEAMENGIYPINKNGEYNYDLFCGWDIKLDDPLFYINKLSDINEYIPLMLLFVVFNNMDLKYLKDNKESIQKVLEKVYSYKRSRFNFHLVSLLYTVSDFYNKDCLSFYLKILHSKDLSVQNESISCIKLMSDDELELVISSLKKNISLNIFKHENLQDFNSLQKKIYATMLHRAFLNKYEIHKKLRDYMDYDTAEYIDIYL